MRDRGGRTLRLRAGRLARSCKWFRRGSQFCPEVFVRTVCLTNREAVVLSCLVCRAVAPLAALITACPARTHASIPASFLVSFGFCAANDLSPEIFSCNFI